MATAYVTNSGSDTAVRDELICRAQQDRLGIHQVVDDPDIADIIIFAEAEDDPFQDTLRRHYLLRRYRNKSFCVCERDHTLPFIPGVYTSVPRRWYRKSRIRSGFYIVMYQHEEVDYVPHNGTEKFLFSFVGSFHTAPVRQKLGQIDYKSAYIENTAKYVHDFWVPSESPRRNEREQVYWEVIRNSSFVLCPRGFAPATTRFFDVLQAGRVPVVLADDWVPPEGPQWSEFCLRVPESNVDQLPQLLEGWSPKASEMGRAAREAWEEWFAPSVTFHRIMEWCLSIRASCILPETVLRAQAYWQLLFQPYRYNYYRSRRTHFERHGRLIL